MMIEIVSIFSALVGLIMFIFYIRDRFYHYKKITWKQAEKKAKEISNKLIADKYLPTMIIGTGRGGAIFGAMLSGCLGHCPLVVIDRKYEWSEQGRHDDMLFPINIPPSYLTKVLLTDGEAHSGGTIRKYYNFLISLGAENVRKAILFVEKGCPVTIEYQGYNFPHKNTRLPWHFSKNYVKYDLYTNKKIVDPYQIRVYFLRHAKTEDDDLYFKGKTDFNISMKGIEETVKLGPDIGMLKLNNIFTSPSIRAKQTALILKGFTHKIDLKTNDYLREMDYGEWDGKRKEDIKTKISANYESWCRNPAENIPKDSESPFLVQKRMLQFLEEIAANYKAVTKRRFLAVSHKTAIRTLKCHFKGIPLSNYREININNLQIVVFVYSNGMWRIDEQDPLGVHHNKIISALKYVK